MAISQQSVFTLTRFERLQSGRVAVAGSWKGVAPDEIADPVLVIHTDSGAEQVPVEELTSGAPGDWAATFALRERPTGVRRTELRFPSLTVELPAADERRARRRFGRVTLPVQESGAPDDGQAADVLALHAATVQAQTEAAEAREAAARLHDELERAQKRIADERRRREEEQARLAESLASLRSLAERALNRERESTHAVNRQLREQEEQLAQARARIDELAGKADGVEAVRAEAEEQQRAADAELARLRSRLDRMAVDAREASERSKAEQAQLREALAQAQRDSGAERSRMEQLRAELAETRSTAEAEMRALRGELEQARGTSAAAEQAKQRVAELEAALGEARAETQRSAAEQEQLRRKLAAVRSAIAELT